MLQWGQSQSLPLKSLHPARVESKIRTIASLFTCMGIKLLQID